MSRRISVALSVLVSLLLGCGGVMPVTSADAAVGADAGTTADAGARDAGALADAGNSDAGTTPDGGALPPRCTVTAASVRCSVRITPLQVLGVARDVYWEAPSTPAPPAGYPVVVMYQGSYANPALTWAEVPAGTAFGGYSQARLQALLLEHGFVVVAPVALGGVAWQTNSGLPWAGTSDAAFIDELLAAFARGDFGPIDTARQYATGISSGGYMTSRMAVSYAGRFRALAIQSASYATCAGALCVLPLALPSPHPPTLFLHGELDLTVPMYTARSYFDALTADGATVDWVTDPLAGHEWLTVAPERVTAWFETH